MSRKVLSLAPIFNDHMVLQRNKPLYIWGEGLTGNQVKVKMSGVEEVTTVKDGRWKVTLPEMNIKGTTKMTVTSGEVYIEVKDVAFGEVYLAGGQSNMAYELKNSLGGYKAINNKKQPNIRYYHVPRIAYEGETVKENEPYGWHLCTREDTPYFSAVAYFFAEQLSDYMDCPIGIIGCNWGGTSITAWMSQKQLMKVEETKDYYEKMVRGFDKEDSKAYRIVEVNYEKAVKEYEEKLKEHSFTIGNAIEHYNKTKQIENPWPPPMGSRSFLRPAGVHETMIKAVSPYTLRGVLWYQGESDDHWPHTYQQLLLLMIKEWRELWLDENLYFFIVQLPTFGGDKPNYDNWATIRAAQYAVAKQDPYTHVAITIDHGDRDNIHPFNKKPVGQRLALLAGYHIYGNCDNPYGPQLKEIKETKSEYILYLNNTDGGIYALGGVAKGFILEDKYTIKFNVEAKIVENTLVIDKMSTDNIKIISYAYQNYIEATVYNSNELPMAPFRREV